MRSGERDEAMRLADELCQTMGPGWTIERLRSGVREVQEKGSASNQMAMESTYGMVKRREFLDADVEEIFTHHDNPEAVPHYVEVREGAKAFAKILLRHVPSCPDQSAMMRKLREVVMTANAGIALGGKY